MAQKKDVLIKVRLNVLATGIRHQGSAQIRPGRDGTQGRNIVDVPAMVLDQTEWETRLANALSVLETGHQLIAGEPPLVESMEEASIGSTTATLKGNVTSNNVSTIVGFQYGTTPSLSGSAVATDSPKQSASDAAFSKALTGLIAETTYYWRAYANDGTKTVYGRIRSFTTPAVEP